MFRNRGWFGGGGLWKPKNPHSLEHLKYLYTLLSKNQTVTEQNRSLLVETLRSIAEILIWGDQNDGSVFDFFLEKNMLSFFLKIMKQKCGSYVCVQLLQTLNILFENIRNETSLYYLLSNNHVNSIIVHKFDFSDEEVMAYYISFLKTLSLKLNCHTIHFFYNEHTNDFPLYTEAIKFFNHPESMVRIAVRTLSLNVYRVDDKAMLKFIRDKTAAPYFSNLVWFIGNHVLELDSCVCNDADHLSCGRLSDLVAEHLDHLHYLNDIFCLDIPSLSKVLADHLMNRLLVPLYVYSLIPPDASPSQEKKPHVSSVTSIFLLSQVFLIMCHAPLVDVLAKVILLGNTSIFSDSQEENGDSSKRSPKFKPSFMAPLESLEKSLENTIKAVASGSLSEDSWEPETDQLESELQREMQLRGHNITDEEKQKRHELNGESSIPLEDKLRSLFVESQHPFLQAVMSMLDSSHDDYTSLLSLCLLYAIRKNPGISEATLNSVLVPTDNWEEKSWYNIQLVEALLKVICRSCQSNSKIRLVTLELCIQIVKLIAIQKGKSYLHDCHLAVIEGAKEEATLLLRNFYKSEEIFVDMFENEYTEMRKRPLNIEYLMMDASVLLPPTGTPMTGIELTKRLPCGEVERARRAIRVFFLLRDLSLSLRGERECQLPLTDPSSCIQTGKVLDLNNSDLISCTVVTKENSKLRRFLVVDSAQLILVEPDTKRLGWGVAMFVGFLQDVEVEGDKDDSRCLLVTVHSSAAQSKRATPLLTAKFVFDDHIRCMAANQRLSKGRAKARQRKYQQIAKLLELPANIQPCSSPPNMTLSMLRQEASARKIKLRYLSDYRQGKLGNTKDRKVPFMSNKVPGFVAANRVESNASSLGNTVTQEPMDGALWKKGDIPLECMSSSTWSESRNDVGPQGTDILHNASKEVTPDLPKSLIPAEGPVISFLKEATKQEALENFLKEAEATTMTPISPPKSLSPSSPSDNSDNNTTSVISTPGREYETSFISNEDTFVPRSKVHHHYDFAETYPPITSSIPSTGATSQDDNLTAASKHTYSNTKIQTV